MGLSNSLIAFSVYPILKISCFQSFKTKEQKLELGGEIKLSFSEDIFKALVQI